MSTKSPRIQIDDLSPLQNLSEQEMAEIYGAGRKGKWKFSGQSLEVLEIREVMSAVTASLTDGVLQIEGTDDADLIRFFESGGDISLQDVEIQANGSTFSSIPVSSVHSVKINSHGADDAIWIGDGGGSLSPAIEIASSPGHDVLHSFNATFDAGFADGVTSLLQVAGNTYTTDADGNVFRNGEEMDFSGFHMMAAAVSGGEHGVQISGIVNMPMLGNVNVQGAIDDQGVYSLTLDPAGGSSEVSLLGGAAKVSLSSVELTPSGPIVKAHATVGSFGQADLELRVTADGNYLLTGTGGVSFGGQSFNGIDFSVGDEDLKFKCPVPSIGDVDFRGHFDGDGQWYVEGTYPEVVMFGTIPLDHITVGIGDDRFAIGAHSGIDGLLDVTVHGDFLYDGRFTIRGDAAVNVVGFDLANGKVVISNDPSVTMLLDRTVQMTLDVDAGIPSGPTVNLHGVVDGNGNYDLSSNVDINIAGLSLTSTSIILKKGDGFRIHSTWKDPLFTATLVATVSPSTGVHFDGTATTKSVGDMNLGNVELHGDADGGKFTLTSKTKAMSVGDFRLGDSYVTISNKNPSGVIQTKLAGTAGVSGVGGISISGDISSSGIYKLTGTNSVSIAGLSLQKAEFTLENGKGLSFRNASLNKFFFDSTISGTVSANGRVRFSGTDSSGTWGGFSLGSITATGDLNNSGTPSSMTLVTTKDLVVASTTFTASMTVAANGLWPSPVLAATATVKGALSTLLSGSAKFEISSSGATFSGDLKLPLSLGTLKNVRGSIYSDGTIQIGSVRVSASSISASSAAGLLKNAGGNPIQIAGALVAIYKSAISDVTKYLANLKFGLTEIANAIWSVRADLGVVAYNLYNHTGSLGKNLTSLAKVLYDVASKASGDRKINVFKAIYHNTPSSVGYVDVIRAMVDGKLVSNNSGEVGKVLFQATGSFKTVATTVYVWLGGTSDKLRYAFWAAAGAAGGSYRYVDAIRAMVDGKLVSNSSSAVGKYVYEWSGNLGTTASTVFQWLGGTADKLGYAFWAVAGSGGANQGYANGIRALWANSYVGTSLHSTASFLAGKLSGNDIVTTLKQLGFAIPSANVKIPGLPGLPDIQINVSTSGGSVSVGGRTIRF